MLFGELLSAPATGGSSRASRYSRISGTKSRQSALYTEDGDIQMDHFIRRMRRSEANIKTGQAKKCNLQKLFAEAKAKNSSEMGFAAHRELRLDEKEAEILERRLALENIDDRLKQAEDDREIATSSKEFEETNIAEANDVLTTVYSEILEVLESLPSDDPDQERAEVSMKAEVIRMSIAHRNEVLMNHEDATKKAEMLLASLEKEEGKLAEEIVVMERRRRNAIAKKMSTSAAIEQGTEDLGALEELVCSVEAETNDLDERMKMIPTNEVIPDFKRMVAELDRFDAKNAKRKRFCATKRAMVANKTKEAADILARRASMSPKSSACASLAQVSPEELVEAVDARIGEITGRQEEVTKAVKDVDDLEARLSEERKDCEAAWEDKMKRTERLREELNDVEHAEVKTAQAVEEIEHLKESERVTGARVEAITKRLERMTGESQEKIDRDPEISFGRERTGEKQTSTDEKHVILNERKARYAGGSEQCDAEEVQAYELNQTVLALEQEVSQYTSRITHADEMLEVEQKKLDEAIAKLPIDQKIKLLANL